jgi:hypothetical protein
MTITTTATTLRTLITLWPDLHAALGDRPIHGAYGLGLRGYLTTLEEHDADQAALRPRPRRVPPLAGA